MFNYTTQTITLKQNLIILSSRKNITEISLLVLIIVQPNRRLITVCIRVENLK